MYSGWHVHDGESPITLQTEYGPQGDGVHGSTGGRGVATEIKHKLILALTADNIFFHLNHVTILYIYLLGYSERMDRLYIVQGTSILGYG